MTTRRSLTTTTAATTAAAAGVLIALSFVPSASATPVADAGRTSAVSHAQAPAAQAPAAQPAANGLADTGAMDTTPYVVGGAGFLGMGAALLLVARRRALALGVAADDVPDATDA